MLHIGNEIRNTFTRFSTCFMFMRTCLFRLFFSQSDNFQRIAMNFTFFIFGWSYLHVDFLVAFSHFVWFSRLNRFKLSFVVERNTVIYSTWRFLDPSVKIRKWTYEKSHPKFGFAIITEKQKGGISTFSYKRRIVAINFLRLATIPIRTFFSYLLIRNVHKFKFKWHI